jgi:hypothetical protein
VSKKRAKKTSYTVVIPIAGSLSIDVEADSEEEAKEVAWGKYDEAGEDAGELEWEAHECIAEGNVCHASTNEIEVIEHDD